MKARLLYVLVAAIVIFVLSTWNAYQFRSEAERAARRIADAIHSSESLSPLVVAPVSLSNRSSIERDSLLRDYLETEISPEGLDILTRHGAFGYLTELLPTEAESIADTARVDLTDCFAFKLQRTDRIAELVLHRQIDGSFRVLRCNDIRQLAEPAPAP
jgi:hypothetical protein